MTNTLLCGECGRRVSDPTMITYRPEPNQGQRESEDVPTDNLHLLVGLHCDECGELVDVLQHPADAKRYSDPNGGDGE